MSNHVFHVVQRMAPGGLEVLVLELARQLPGPHTIVSLEGEAATLEREWRRLGDSGVTLMALDKRAGVEWRLVPRLARLFKSHAATTVVTHHAGPLLYAGVAARLCAPGVGLIHVEHDSWHYRSRKRRAVMRLGFDMTNPQIVAVSEGIKSQLHQLFRRDVQAIANGVDLEKFQPSRDRARRRLGVARDTRVLGAAGRLEHIKGHDVLIEAFALLPSDIRLFIAGDGAEKRALVEKAEKSGLGERVTFLGHRDDMAELYAAFDVFCQPSRHEGLPIAVLEAQACGVPVVATAVGDMANALCKKSGRLAPSERPDLLAQELTAALAAPSKTCPRDFIRDHFNWSHTLACYDSMIGG